FGLAWFVLFLIPTLINPNPALPSHFMEDRLYAAFAGIVIMFMEIGAVRNMRFGPDTAFALSALLILVFSFRTFQYSGAYEDRKAFWENAARTSPHSYVAHYNLGTIYLDERQLNPAEAEFVDAVMLEPDKALTYNALGLVFRQERSFGRAERAFKKASALSPGSGKNGD
ncbi:MAG: hypothetical protein PHS37_09100, partial [Candidatus Omnitrophica bacterium]|nr:hypothetical protein [Candidatus Omnitrophota bacterium]